jgi:hypothetical protein
MKINHVKKQIQDLVDCDLVWKRERHCGLPLLWVGKCKLGCAGYVRLHPNGYSWYTSIHGWGIIKKKEDHQHTKNISDFFEPYRNACFVKDQGRKSDKEVGRKRKLLEAKYKTGGIEAVLQYICKPYRK